MNHSFQQHGFPRGRQHGERARISAFHTPDADRGIDPAVEVEASSHAAALHQISPNGTASSRIVPDLDHGEMRKRIDHKRIAPPKHVGHKAVDQEMTTEGRVPARSTPESLDTDEQIAKSGLVHTTEIQLPKVEVADSAADGTASRGETLFKDLLKCKP